jgi:hypothetical protein
MYLFYASASLELILDSVVIKIFIYNLYALISDMCCDILMILLYICVTWFWRIYDCSVYVLINRVWHHVPSILSSLLLYRVRLNSHSIWSSPRALGWLVESGWGSIQSLVFYPYHPPNLKNKSLMTRVPQPLSLESKSPRFGIKDLKSRGMQYMMVKILWWRWANQFSKFVNLLFRDEFPRKMVKQITSQTNTQNYLSNQSLIPESMTK